MFQTPVLLTSILSRQDFICAGLYLMHHLCEKEESGTEINCCGSPPRLCLHEWELIREALRVPEVRQMLLLANY